MKMKTKYCYHRKIAKNVQEMMNAEVKLRLKLKRTTDAHGLWSAVATAVAKAMAVKSTATAGRDTALFSEAPA